MKKIVIANWKMNPATAKEAEAVYKAVIKSVPNIKNAEIVICPPSVFLDRLAKIKTAKAKLGAQDAFYEKIGAFTGKVSAKMLSALGAKYAILGHSEKRALGNTNDIVNKKIRSAISIGLLPIVCIGEKERDDHMHYLHFLRSELEESLAGIPKNLISKIIIAYEPIWAIGKDAIREATAEEFREVYIFIKKVLSDKFGIGSVAGMRIVYGGSVHPDNAEAFIREGGADGFLVGRDSLDPKKFSKITRICEASKK